MIKVVFRVEAGWGKSVEPENVHNTEKRLLFEKGSPLFKINSKLCFLLLGFKLKLSQQLAQEIVLKNLSLYICRTNNRAFTVSTVALFTCFVLYIHSQSFISSNCFNLVMLDPGPISGTYIVAWESTLRETLVHHRTACSHFHITIQIFAQFRLVLLE